MGEIRPKTCEQGKGEGGSPAAAVGPDPRPHESPPRLGPPNDTDQTLLLRHFTPILRHFSPVFSIVVPGSQRAREDDGKTAKNGQETGENTAG